MRRAAGLGPALALALLLAGLPFPADAAPGAAADVPQASAGAPQGWLPGPLAVAGRLALLAFERSGGGPREAHLAGGARGGYPLFAGRWLVVGASAGYLLGYTADGTAAVNVRTLHHLLDLRLEAGLPLHPFLLYLAAGGLLDLAQVRLHALGDEDTALGAHPGAAYGVGVQAVDGRWLLRLEFAGLHRPGKDDLLAEFAAGVQF